MIDSNRFTHLKNIFIDDSDGIDYIKLDKSMFVYNQILSSLQKPLKLILFYGSPGSGKTFLLHKIKNDLKDKQQIIFFPYPFFSEKEFLHSLYKEIFHVDSLESIDSYEIFLRLYKEQSKHDEKYLKSNPLTIMLDEAQMYPSDLIEKIRLMADTYMFKFLFTVHKTKDGEDILAKEYFQTRIWESIELENIDEKEIKVYINSKIKEQAVNMFCDDDYKLIMQFTHGNLRTINKLMYKVFELFEFYEHHRPSMLQEPNINTQIIEMSAIDRKLIDA